MLRLAVFLLALWLLKGSELHLRKNLVDDHERQKFPNFPWDTITQEKDSGRRRDMAFVTGHKIASVYMHEFTKCLCGKVHHLVPIPIEETDRGPWIRYWGDPSLTCYFAIDYVETPGNKTLFTTRHPMDRIISGSRYHAMSTDSWLNGPETHKNYEHLNESISSLYKHRSEAERISLEILKDITYWERDTGIMNRIRNHPNYHIMQVEKLRLQNEATLKGVASFMELDYGRVVMCDRFANVPRTGHITTTAAEKELLKTEMYEFQVEKYLECQHFVQYKEVSGGVAAVEYYGYETKSYKEAERNACNNFLEEYVAANLQQKMESDGEERLEKKLGENGEYDYIKTNWLFAMAVCIGLTVAIRSFLNRGKFCSNART